MGRGSLCAGTGRSYLMYPNAGSGEYSTEWSTCSQSAIADYVAGNGECFVVPDPCANGGPCCGSDGQLRGAGTVCRDADPTQVRL